MRPRAPALDAVEIIRAWRGLASSPFHDSILSRAGAAEHLRRPLPPPHQHADAVDRPAVGDQDPVEGKERLAECLPVTLLALLESLRASVRSRAALHAEILALRHLGLQEVLTAFRSPWQNGYVERLSGRCDASVSIKSCRWEKSTCAGS